MNRIGRMTLAMLEVVFVGFAMSRRVAGLKLFPISIYKRLNLRGIEECRRPALLPVEYAKGSDAVWHISHYRKARRPAGQQGMGQFDCGSLTHWKTGCSGRILPK